MADKGLGNYKCRRCGKISMGTLEDWVVVTPIAYEDDLGSTFICKHCGNYSEV